MKYTIRELEKQFQDFRSSELIVGLVNDGYEDEATGEEIEVSVDLLAEDIADWYDSAGYSWRKQLQEAQRENAKVFSVADKYHTWSMGLVTEK